MPKFTRGDVVVSKDGWSPRVVYHTDGDYAFVKYITTYTGTQKCKFNMDQLEEYIFPLETHEKTNREIILTDTKHLVFNNKTNGKAKEKDMLYQITQIENGVKYVFYGTKLAVDSNGKWVMELKGSRGVAAFDEKDISEVTPYTINVKFLDSAKVYSYMSKKKDGIKEGDLLVINSNGNKTIVLVVGIDTKSKAATKDIDIVGKVRVDAVN